MTDRNPLRDVFITGILNYEPRLNGVILGGTGQEEPEYPFASFTIQNNGVAPWETRQRTRNGLTPVENTSDPEFDDDIEIDYETDYLITIAFLIKGDPVDPLSGISQQVEGYFYHRFNDDADDNGLDFALEEINATGRVQEQLEGMQPVKYSVDVQLVTSLEDEKTVATIEELEFDSNSDVAGGESIS